MEQYVSLLIERVKRDQVLPSFLLPSLPPSLPSFLPPSLPPSLPLAQTFFLFSHSCPLSITPQLLALYLSKQGQRAQALRVMRRIKIMEEELKGAEGVEEEV